MGGSLSKNKKKQSQTSQNAQQLYLYTTLSNFNDEKAKTPEHVTATTQPVLTEEKKTAPPLNDQQISPITQIDINTLTISLQALRNVKQLNIPKILTIAANNAAYLDNIKAALAIFCFHQLPYSQKILEEMVRQGKFAILNTEALIKLGKHTVLTEARTLGIIKLGRFAPDIVEIFIRLEDNNIEITDKIWNKIIKAAPSDDTKNIAEALLIIVNYIKEAFTRSDIKNIKPTQNGLLISNENLNFDWITQKIRFFGTEIVDETSKETALNEYLLITLSNKIISAIAKADNPEPFAEAIVFLHMNKIILSNTSLKMLAANSYHAVTIALALQSLHSDGEQPLEEIIQQAIQAGEDADTFVSNYRAELLKTADEDSDHHQSQHTKSNEQKTAEQRHNFNLHLGAGSMSLDFAIVFKKHNKKTEEQAPELKPKPSPHPALSSKSN